MHWYSKSMNYATAATNRWMTIQIHLCTKYFTYFSHPNQTRFRYWLHSFTKQTTHSLHRHGHQPNSSFNFYKTNNFVSNTDYYMSDDLSCTSAQEVSHILLYTLCHSSSNVLLVPLVHWQFVHCLLPINFITSIVPILVLTVVSPTCFGLYPGRTRVSQRTLQSCFGQLVQCKVTPC